MASDSFLPFIPGLNLQDSATPSQNLRRIILVNPLTQGMVVIERTHTADSSVMDMLSGKKGQPPASKESIEALKSVEIERDGGECVICLEEWATGEMAKEMPCRHIFHGGCIENWLRIHGSCPVCRYKMPVDDSKGRSGWKINDGERRRDVWMRFVFTRDTESSVVE